MNNNFDTWRRKYGYSEKSIKGHNHHIKLFKSWCSNQNINLESINYSQLLQFIDSERERSILNQSIINKINAIRIYFDYLQESGIVGQNIVRRIRIRQSGKKVLPETLTSQQLENVYQNFVNLPEWEYYHQREKELHKRNVIVLGFLVYQGLTSGDIAKLEVSHINLMEGKIYIPSSRKSSARTLKLQANQILPIQTYLEEFTPKPYLFPIKKHTGMITGIIR